MDRFKCFQFRTEVNSSGRSMGRGSEVDSSGRSTGRGFSADEVHGYASSASSASLDQLLSTKLLVCLDVDLVSLADDLVW